jgi:hypothetical protein
MIGHRVTSLDPAEAPNAGARQEVEKLNLALEMGDNVMIYLDDIQHCNAELLQKFISLCDAQRVGGTFGCIADGGGTGLPVFFQPSLVDSGERSASASRQRGGIGKLFRRDSFAALYGKRRQDKQSQTLPAIRRRCVALSRVDNSVAAVGKGRPEEHGKTASGHCSHRLGDHAHRQVLLPLDHFQTTCPAGSLPVCAHAKIEIPTWQLVPSFFLPRFPSINSP